VVEDTSVTLDDLRDALFPEEVVRAVDLLTKREGESREDAALRAVTDPVARAVKLADVTDNMDLSRIPSPGKKDFKRLAEYVKVKEILESGPSDAVTEYDGGDAREGVDIPGIDPRHPRIRINYSSAFTEAARKLAYKYNDLGAVATIYHDKSEGRFSFRERLCYFSSDPVTVSIAESLARDVSQIGKVHPRFVSFPQRDVDFIIYLIGKPPKRKKKASAEKVQLKDNEDLVQCPQCPAKVHKERLARHINKAHKVSKNKGPKPVRASSSIPEGSPSVRVMKLTKRTSTS
jgi:uncharacterized C2H2 Zn-finger protein